MDIRVVSRDGTDVEPEAAGEIWLRGDTRMRGYRGSPEATAEAFAGEWRMAKS